jgi:hypothetical protein
MTAERTETLQPFNAARCFRSEFRREIFALAAPINSARVNRFRGGRLWAFAFELDDGISGKEGWIVPS